MAFPVAVALALVFAWTNGFHDAANAVATSIETRALTPRRALALAAVLNAVGALLGVGVALTVGQRLIDVPLREPGLGVVIAGLGAAVAWNLLTWWLGLPTSSSHALLGGLIGAGVAASARVSTGGVVTLIVLPLLISPVVGYLLSWGLVGLLRARLDGSARAATQRRFRLAQTVSASAVALGHGLQDGQKTMGVLILALVAAGRDPGPTVPWWGRLAAAGAIGAGTYSGGWRLIRTLGRRIVRVEPLTGFAAETVSATLLYVASSVVTLPVSSTQVVTAAVAGAGSHPLRLVRWHAVGRIVLVWLLTPAATAVLAWLAYRAGAMVPE